MFKKYLAVLLLLHFILFYDILTRVITFECRLIYFNILLSQSFERSKQTIVKILFCSEDCTNHGFAPGCRQEDFTTAHVFNGTSPTTVEMKN